VVSPTPHAQHCRSRYSSAAARATPVRSGSHRRYAAGFTGPTFSQVRETDLPLRQKGRAGPWPFLLANPPGGRQDGDPRYPCGHRRGSHPGTTQGVSPLPPIGSKSGRGFRADLRSAIGRQRGSFILYCTPVYPDAYACSRARLGKAFPSHDRQGVVCAKITSPAYGGRRNPVALAAPWSWGPA
jgi:hypothetical protein